MLVEGMRLLVFSAHAADFCSRAGGTIIRTAQAGGAAHVVDLTYGERCEAPALWARETKPTIEEVKKIRAQEIQAAAGILGASIECLDFDDCPLVVGPDRRLRVLEAIRAFKPDLVLSHWMNDIMHPDHVVTTEAVLWACAYSGAGGIVTSSAPYKRVPLVCYETTSGTAPVSGFSPDTYVDITEVFDQKILALRELAAQPNLPEMYEVLGRYRAMEATHTAGITGCRYAEGFSRLGTVAS